MCTKNKLRNKKIEEGEKGQSHNGGTKDWGSTHFAQAGWDIPFGKKRAMKMGDWGETRSKKKNERGKGKCKTISTRRDELGRNREGREPQRKGETFLRKEPYAVRGGKNFGP